MIDLQYFITIDFTYSLKSMVERWLPRSRPSKCWLTERPRCLVLRETLQNVRSVSHWPSVLMLVLRQLLINWMFLSSFYIPKNSYWPPLYLDRFRYLTLYCSTNLRILTVARVTMILEVFSKLSVRTK